MDWGPGEVVYVSDAKIFGSSNEITVRILSCDIKVMVIGDR